MIVGVVTAERHGVIQRLISGPRRVNKGHGMNRWPIATWSAFKEAIERYSQLTLPRQEQFFFRWQADRRWSLKTTLDRQHDFADDDEREERRLLLLKHFQREAIGLAVDLPSVGEELAWELLARHHGLPSSFLDWSRSPYIAAFFAFQDQACLESDNVAVWTFDREVFLAKEIPEIEIIGDEHVVRINPRAIEQRAVFIQQKSISRSLEDFLDESLTRIEIPSSERSNALVDLDQMLINSRTIFRDLDGAARTALKRVTLLRGPS